MLNSIFSLILSEQLAHACATCGFVDESTPYYFGMVVFLSLLPIVVIGSVILYIRKQHKAASHDAHEQ